MRIIAIESDGTQAIALEQIRTMLEPINICMVIPAGMTKVICEFSASESTLAKFNAIVNSGDSANISLREITINLDGLQPELQEASTADVGDTSAITFSTDILNGKARLLVTNTAEVNYILEYQQRFLKSYNPFLSSAQFSLPSSEALTITPAVERSMLQYDLGLIDYSISSISASAIPEDASSRIKINGVPVSQGQTIACENLGVGSNTIPVEVVAPSGYSERYNFTLTRASSNKLASLFVIRGAGNLAYTPSINASSDDTYTLTASLTGTAGLKVRAYCEDSQIGSINGPINLTVQLNENTEAQVLQGSIISVPGVPIIGENELKVKVTSVIGNLTRTYRVKFTRTT